MNTLRATPLARSSLSICIAALLALPAQVALATVPTDYVTDCADPGLADAATLRNVIFNAAPGDIIELSGVGCSTITLAAASGEIYIMQRDLTIRNSGPNAITIDGSQLPSGDQGFSNSRVFTHKPNEIGTLTIDHVNVTGGHVQHDDGAAYGGCILTNGTLVLTNSTVSACSAVSATPGHEARLARGGAIYAAGDITLTGSTITGSTVTSPLTEADGGGVFSKGHVQATNSVISNNTVQAANQSFGGGVHALGGISLSHSTVSGNAMHASTNGAYGGGLASPSAGIDVSYSTIYKNSVYSPPNYGSGGGVFGQANVSLLKTTIAGNYSSGTAAGIAAYLPYNANTLTIKASTISGNTAQGTVGGIVSNAYTTKIYNSTIVFNNASQSLNRYGATAWPGLALYATRENMLVTLESNILAQNYYGAGIEGDLSALEFQMFTATIDPAFTHNLIRTSVPLVNGLPSGTSTGCPLLGPLRDNGGPTWTHALLSHSAAIDAGANSLNYHQDQRAAESDLPPYPYPRVSPPAADIGAYEVNKADVVFNAAFDTCAPLPPPS